MKLSCLRCKRKKIKCDRSEPVCHQCITAKVECQYVERRQRHRAGQQRVAVQDLNQRLEQLEKHISSTGDERSPSVPMSMPRQEITRRSMPAPSPAAALTVDDGQESWIYRLASGTRTNFQSQTTPVATPATRINNAMLSLNEALDDLGQLRARTEALNVDLKLSPAESRACIERFASLMSAMVVPGIFASSMIDVNLLQALPEVIDSPYVSIDPGVRVVYYNALYYGLLQTNGAGDPLTTKAYMKIIESVPAWLEADGLDMDGHTAALTAWSAINNHDYQLSWKFHCKSVSYIQSKGIDKLDTTPTKSFEEQDKRNALRYLYWHIMSIDILFRLFYGKPAIIRWSLMNVRPPDIFRPDNMQPSASQVTMSVVWIRYTYLTVAMLNLFDETPKADHGYLAPKVDEFCLQLEALMVEWRLDDLMNAAGTINDYRCLLADHIMNMYAIVIGMQRLIQKSRPGTITLRAARRVVNIIFQFYMDPTLNDRSKTICTHFITFYPFCAVFTLYEHILACREPDECDSDIEALENIGLAMVQVSTQHQDFTPFAKTINALNRVSRTLQDERRMEKTRNEAGHNQTEQSMILPSTNFDAFQNLVATELPDFDPSALSSLPDYPADFEGENYPFGFVRALENDFVARNWQAGWWDLSGGVNEGLGEI